MSGTDLSVNRHAERVCASTPAAPASMARGRDGAPWTLNQVQGDAKREGGAPSLTQAADAFEAVFLRQMLASMRSASFGETLFNSAATEQYRTMLDSTLADSMAQGSKLGIAEALTARLNRLAGTP